MKVVLLLAVVLASLCLVYGQQQVCTVGVCALSGEYCGASNTTTVTCVGGTYCNVTVCAPYIPVGANCSGSGCQYSCDNGKCVPYDYQIYSPGEACTENYQCFYRNSTVSGPSTCVNGSCFGLAGNSTCDMPFNDPHECINSYCDQSKICAPYLPEGSPCLYNITGACAGMAECQYTSDEAAQSGIGACILTNEVKLGANCTYGTCPENSYCGSDSICRGSASITYAPCNDSADCSNGLTCMCYPNGQNNCSAFVTPPGLYDTLTNLQSCLLKCDFAGSECWTVSCGSQYCAYLDLTLAFQVVTGNYPTCAQDYLRAGKKDQWNQLGLCKADNNSPNTAMWVYIGIAVVAGVLVIAGFGFYVYRRNRGDYQSI